MFDVYVFDKDTNESDLPTEGTYYLITADGIFIRKDTDLFAATVKVSSIPFLGHMRPSVTPKLPPIPAQVILKAWLFFRKVFRKRKAESELNLYYHKVNKEYLLVCRPQSVSFTSVNYGLSEKELLNNKEALSELTFLTESGYLKIGTIHSHCSFDAFHSHTDEHDESSKDGIHITIGHVDRDNFSLAASWAVNNNRFQLKPESVISDVVEIDSCFFKINLSFEEQQQIEEGFQPVLDEWMGMVSEASSRSMQWKPVVYTIPSLSTMDKRDLRRVKSHAFALLNYWEQIPSSRMGKLKTTVCEFFKKDNITDNDLELASRINPDKKVYDETEY